jgi:hypothetical protein
MRLIDRFPLKKLKWSDTHFLEIASRSEVQSLNTSVAFWETQFVLAIGE